MKCEMCENFDPAKYIALVLTKNNNLETKYLCRPCCRDLEKIGRATQIEELPDGDWEY